MTVGAAATVTRAEAVTGVEADMVGVSPRTYAEYACVSVPLTRKRCW